VAPSPSADDAHGLSASAEPEEGASVEAALTKVLEGASAAGQWGVVAQMAKELEARRLAKEPNVVTLGRRAK
jgi:hypothetical protein